METGNDLVQGGRRHVGQQVDEAAEDPAGLEGLPGRLRPFAQVQVLDEAETAPKSPAASGARGGRRGPGSP